MPYRRKNRYLSYFRCSRRNFHCCPYPDRYFHYPYSRHRNYRYLYSRCYLFHSHRSVEYPVFPAVLSTWQFLGHKLQSASMQLSVSCLRVLSLFFSVCILFTFTFLFCPFFFPRLDICESPTAKQFPPFAYIITVQCFHSYRRIAE